MTVVKNDKVFTITELKKEWKVVWDITVMKVTYMIDKELCETAEDVKQFIMKDDAF